MASGVWNFTPKKDESKGMRLIRFNAKLEEMCKMLPIRLITFEAAVTYGKFPNMVGAEMIGVLKLFCERSEIEYRSYTPSEIKKHASGKGGATKDKMVALAKEKYNCEVIDDNHADALHLFDLSLSDLGLKPKQDPF